MKRFLAGLLVVGAIIVGVTLTLREWWPRVSLGSAPSRPSMLVLGESKIVVPKGALIGVQVDRVIRDVAWVGSRWDERIPANRAPETSEDLVPYMEGVLVGELMRFAAARVVPLTPGTARFDGRSGVWFAPDAAGRFRFALDPSGSAYRFARHVREDLIEITDTHGFNSVAAAAANARPHLVVACMDLAPKADAALYLAEMGIHAYAPTDRFSHRLLGYQIYRPRAATIIGSAPIRAGPGQTAIIGNQPVAIRIGETVVAQWTDRPYVWQYSDTPWRYFSELAARYFLDIPLVRVKADAGQLGLVIDEARVRGAEVVAVRVGKAVSMDEAVHDAAVLAAWLNQNPRHRAVLFHSAAYEPGYRLFFQFPGQTTFGDMAPLVKP